MEGAMATFKEFSRQWAEYCQDSPELPSELGELLEHGAFRIINWESEGGARKTMELLLRLHPSAPVSVLSESGGVLSVRDRFQGSAGEIGRVLLAHAGSEGSPWHGLYQEGAFAEVGVVAGESLLTALGSADWSDVEAAFRSFRKAHADPLLGVLFREYGILDALRGQALEALEKAGKERAGIEKQRAHMAEREAERAPGSSHSKQQLEEARDEIEEAEKKRTRLDRRLKDPGDGLDDDASSLGAVARSRWERLDEALQARVQRNNDRIAAVEDRIAAAVQDRARERRAIRGRILDLEVHIKGHNERMEAQKRTIADLEAALNNQAGQAEMDHFHRNPINIVLEMPAEDFSYYTCVFMDADGEHGGQEPVHGMCIEGGFVGIGIEVSSNDAEGLAALVSCFRSGYWCSRAAVPFEVGGWKPMGGCGHHVTFFPGTMTVGHGAPDEVQDLRCVSGDAQDAWMECTDFGSPLNWSFGGHAQDEGESDPRPLVLSLAMIAGVDIDALPGDARDKREEWERELLLGTAAATFPGTDSSQWSVG
jgi:hypothetical protein